MKNVILIFARSGSKGLKNKNIKNFSGKPLIYWTINQAKKLEILILLFYQQIVLKLQT